MIKGVGDGKPGRIEPTRVGLERSARVARDPGLAPAKAEAPKSLAGAALVAEGPPVDMARVAVVKAAIAEGRYPVDPIRIAEGMIALGFGRRG